MKVLLDKMKHDAEWTIVSASNDPLLLISLIEKTVLSQTEDQYPFATAYDQEEALYSFAQNAQTNEVWYERFNTKVDVATAIGVPHKYSRVLLEYVAPSLYPGRAFDSLDELEMKAVQASTEERYLSYCFLRKSGKQHSKLRVDLQDKFTTGQDNYPATRQEVLHLLDKYTKNVVTKTPASEGTSFAQKGGTGEKKKKDKDKDKKKAPYDKAAWKNRSCYICGEEGHPASHCPDKEKKDGQKKTSFSSLKKENEKLKKSFATMETKLHEYEEDFNSEDEGTMHFQCAPCESHLQFVMQEIPGVESSMEKQIVLHLWGRRPSSQSLSR